MSSSTANGPRVVSSVPTSCIVRENVSKILGGSWEKAFNVVVMEGKIVHDFGRIAICYVLGDGLRMATLMTDDNTRYRFDRYDIVNGEDPQNACERMVMGRQQRMVTATLAIPSDTALL